MHTVFPFRFEAHFQMNAQRWKVIEAENGWFVRLPNGKLSKPMSGEDAKLIAQTPVFDEVVSAATDSTRDVIKQLQELSCAYRRNNLPDTEIEFL